MNSVMSHLSERLVAVSVTKLLINNRWIANESGKTFATIDPATGAEICQVSEADAADVEKAIRAAGAAFEQGPSRKTQTPEREHANCVSDSRETKGRCHGVRWNDSRSRL